jgi:DNA-binding NtrC family response regulator
LDSSVLILGEMGSGKESVARALHAASPRKSGPFIVVPWGAFADGLAGLAEGGTLFIRDAGELDPERQLKLIRAIEANLGSFRLMASSWRDLKGMAAEGRFRDDLYFRLAALSLQVPPLRQRGDDVVVLAEQILRRIAPGRPLRFAPEAEALLKRYRWPGNLRELRNVVERAALLSPGEILRLELALSDTSPAHAGKNLAALMDEAEKRLVEEALGLAEGNQSKAAKWLGLERSSLQYKIKKHGLG